MNIIIGNNAAPLSTANGNIIIGQDAGERLTTAVSTVAIGHNALEYNQTGGNNTAIGYRAMWYTRSSWNVAIGTTALAGSNTTTLNTGQKNTAIGFEALKNNSSGSNNTAIGYQAGKSNPSGSANTICIGNGANVTASNMCRIGGDDNIKVGIGTSSPECALDVNGDIRIRAADGNASKKGIYFRHDPTNNTDDGSNFLSGGLYPYNCSIFTYDHSDSGFSGGLSINGYDGVSICTGSNTRNERVRVLENGEIKLQGTDGVSHIFHSTNQDWYRRSGK